MSDPKGVTGTSVAGQRFVKWLSAPGSAADLAIHQELLKTLRVHPGMILSGAAYLLVMSVAYAILQNMVVGLLLSAVIVVVAVRRVMTARAAQARGSWNERDTEHVITWAFVWTPVASLTGLLCASSGQTLLLVMSAFMITGMAFGSSYSNAAAPRFAKAQAAGNLLPFIMTVGCLHMPHMRWILIQAPLWMGATFFVIDKAYCAKTDLIHAQQRASFLALNDQLTGLANRSKIMAELIHRCHSARRTFEQSSYVLFLDLDGFKGVNDVFGHGAGDELLRAVATRLNDAVRPVDFLGRMGGDEFIVILKDLARKQVEEVAERMVQRMAEPFDLSVAENVRIGVSIGGVPLEACSVNNVLEQADRLLYAAKRAGKGTVRLIGGAISTDALTA